MPYKLPHPEAAPPPLDASRVPPALRHLLPLAQKYGISDDGYRDEVVDNLDTSERSELIAFLHEYDDALDEWLAGPEANSLQPSKEYIAFSALRMAADYADVSAP